MGGTRYAVIASGEENIRTDCPVRVSNCHGGRQNATASTLLRLWGHILIFDFNFCRADRRLDSGRWQTVQFLPPDPP